MAPHPARIPAHGLSEREREVLRRLLDGMSHKQIADELQIARGTVDAHVANIYRKRLHPVPDTPVAAPGDFLPRWAAPGGRLRTVGAPRGVAAMDSGRNGGRAVSGRMPAAELDTREVAARAPSVVGRPTRQTHPLDRILPVSAVLALLLLGAIAPRSSREAHAQTFYTFSEWSTDIGPGTDYCGDSLGYHAPYVAALPDIYLLGMGFGDRSECGYYFITAYDPNASSSIELPIREIGPVNTLDDWWDRSRMTDCYVPQDGEVPPAWGTPQDWVAFAYGQDWGYTMSAPGSGTYGYGVYCLTSYSQPGTQYCIYSYADPSCGATVGDASAVDLSPGAWDALGLPGYYSSGTLQITVMWAVN
jgi:hypothetical protein